MTEDAIIDVDFDSDFLHQTFIKQAKALKGLVIPREVTRGFNILQRSCVPIDLQDDTITWKSIVLNATMGSGKTTLLSGIANSIESHGPEGWLNGSIFEVEPMIVFANSLAAVFTHVEDNYAGEDYLFIAVDDAIRHASSRLGMSRAGRKQIFDYAGVRHILEERCGVHAPGFAIFFWVTQRFRELAPMMRGAQLFIYKAINAAEGDLKDLIAILGPDAVDWLSGITEQIYLWNNYEFMDYFLLQSAWDPAPIRMHWDRRGKQIRKYPVITDRTHDEQLAGQIEFLEDYCARRPDFLPLVGTKKGANIIADLITDNFPDTVVTMSKVQNAFVRRLFETGLFSKPKEDSKRVKKRTQQFYCLAKEWYNQNKGNPPYMKKFLPELGFSSLNALQVFFSRYKHLAK